MSATVADRGSLVLAALVVALGAAGCSGDGSATSTSPSTSTTATIGGATSPSASPSPSATDRQAQAYESALKTYNAFWTQFTDILRKQSEPLALRPIARGEAFSYAVQTARDAKAQGQRLSGSVSHLKLEPKSFAYGGTTQKPTRVQLQDCQDLSTAQFVDRNGKQVTRDADSARFVRFDVTMVNFSPSLVNEWQVDGFKTTAVTSCS